MKKDLAKQYDPSIVEDRIYADWLRGGYFHARRDPGKKPFTIVIPPPNITGKLHMGHAIDNTLQDAIIRYKRMRGFDTLWLPGTDHASIATEAKIVDQLRSEGLSKEQVGREAFLERAWKWREDYGGTIIKQLKKLGSSCDWERERFTLDEGCSKAVREVFVRLYERGLIYRGERMVHWCPKCHTSISDVEVEYEEQQGHFWHLKYPLSDGSAYLELATTRPETLLADTAVAVNPDDDRYKSFVGKTVILPIVHREIPVVADEHASPEFGTGVVKITPAHDPNDFEVGKRHDLPVLECIDADAKITADYPKYAGMDRYEARKAIIEDLKAEGALLSIEDCVHNVGTCQRCHTTIEPRVSKQWFVKMEPLAGPAIEAVKNGETRFVPKRFEKIYFNWLENIRDWCISRQLWWGHRIPAWYCADCGEITVSRTDPTCCAHCGGKDLTQDPDTLDTWFSSALWPFSTLGWPDDTEDLKFYYPTSTLVTGYDIIPFWVMRMMFSGIAYTGQAPFDTVLIHGLVRDAQGRKMSKSLGNGIDPLEEISKYGADALRFYLCEGNSPGNDMRYITEKVESARNFANKLWNASRFVLMNLDEDEKAPHIPDELAPEDKWILGEYNETVRGVTEQMESYEIGIAVGKLYEFIREVYCDWYIEIAKSGLNSDDPGRRAAVRAVLVYVLSNTLKLLHPFMPFITEEIWQTLPHEGDSIMVSPWPTYDPELSYPEQTAAMENVMAAVKAVRNRRAEMNVPPSRKAELFIATAHPGNYAGTEGIFARLASASGIKVSSGFDIPGAVTVVTTDATVYIPMSELIDVEAEIKRLSKELEKAKKDLAGVESKLGNPGFTEKAPPAVVENQRQLRQKLLEQIKMLTDNLGKLG